MSPKENHGRMRKSLKRAGDIEIPMDPDYYDKLHDRIMSSIEDKEILPASKIEKSKSFLKRNWFNWSQIGLGIFLVAGLGLSTTQRLVELYWSSKTVQLVTNEKKIIEEATSAPEQFSSSLLSSQNNADFMQDVASRTLDQYGTDQLKEILN